MSRSYAVYHDTGQGPYRVGTFRGPAGSVRNVSRVLFARYPHLTGKVYLAKRIRLNGRWVDDSERIAVERED